MGRVKEVLELAVRSVDEVVCCVKLYAHELFEIDHSFHLLDV